MKEIKKIKRNYLINATVIVLAIAFLSILPISMVIQASENTGTIPILTRTANLVSPSGSINPHGLATYDVYESGQRELEIEAQDVNSADGTVLTFIVAGNQVGQQSILAQRAKLKLRTQDGQTVPVINGGELVEVKLGATLLVSGNFDGGGSTPTPTVSPTGSPTGSPSPSPTGSPSPSPTVSPSPSPSPGESEIFAALSGSTINGVLPRGYAQYEVHSSRTEIEIRIRQINLSGGTNLTVSINNTTIGQMVLESDGEARLRLRSDNGDTVPVITGGEQVEIKNGGTVILSGVFSSATPTPSPTGSPSPSPSQGRYFEAHLTGASSTARGEVKVFLNSSETLATLTAEFHNLSSAQTGARINADLGNITLVHDFGVIGGTNGNLPSATIAVSAAQVQQLRTGLWIATISSVNNPGGELTGQLLQHSDGADFDGDGGDDLAVFRPSTGTWYAQNSQGFSAQVFGGAGDKVVSADYDGDGKTDTAVFKNVNGSGVWEIKHSSDGGLTTDQFGLSTDDAVRGDFDGDGLNDLAVFRPSTGVWYVKKSNNSGYIIVQFGLNGDKAIPVDFDGDGKDDIAVFRPSDGNWYWLNSSNGQFSVAHFGANGDVPIGGDFDGDGKADLSVYRPSTGAWYIYRSSDGNFDIRQFGLTDDIPVAGNYEGDGKTDIAVFRPSTGIWYIWRSVDNTFDFKHFGLTGDVPTIVR